MPTITGLSRCASEFAGRSRPKGWGSGCPALAAVLTVALSLASAGADQPPEPRDPADLPAVTRWLGDYLRSIHSNTSRAERALARAELEVDLTRVAVSRLRGRADAGRIADEVFPGDVLLDRRDGLGEISGVTVRRGGRSVTVRVGEAQTAMSAARATLTRARNDLRQAQRIGQLIEQLAERAEALAVERDLTPREVQARVRQIIRDADALRVRYNLPGPRPVPAWAEPSRRTLTEAESIRVSSLVEAAIGELREPGVSTTTVFVERDQTLLGLGVWQGPARGLDLTEMRTSGSPGPTTILLTSEMTVRSGRPIPRGATIAWRGDRWHVTLPPDREQATP